MQNPILVSKASSVTLILSSKPVSPGLPTSTYLRKSPSPAALSDVALPFSDTSLFSTISRNQNYEKIVLSASPSSPLLDGRTSPPTASALRLPSPATPIKPALRPPREKIIYPSYPLATADAAIFVNERRSPQTCHSKACQFGQSS